MKGNLKAIINSLLGFVIGLLLFGCKNPAVIDEQVHMPNNNWTYLNKISTVFEPNGKENYSLYLTIRTTTEYKYSNLFILFKVKDSLGKEEIRRYNYKIAELDGQWTGSGSGSIFSYKFPLLTNRSFKEGKLLLSVEQNMKDNPLKGVTNAGLVIEPVN